MPFCSTLNMSELWNVLWGLFIYSSSKGEALTVGAAFGFRLMVISHLHRTSTLHYLSAAAVVGLEFHCGTDNFSAWGVIIRCRFEMKIGSHGNNAEAQQLWGIFRFQYTHAQTKSGRVWRYQRLGGWLILSKILTNTHLILLRYHNQLYNRG